MEELQTLRVHIEQGNYQEALILIGEMEEMSREDKIFKIRTFIKNLTVVAFWPLNIVPEILEKTKNELYSIYE